MICRKIIVLSLVTFMAVFTGCRVGPAYHRPAMAYDSLFRFSPSKDTISMGDLQWKSVLKDEVLKALIDTAIKNNFDVRIAFARIEEASGYIKYARGAQFPQIGIGAEGAITQQSVPERKGTVNYKDLTAVANISYEIDLWGKLRHAKDAAKAQYFSQVAYQQLVRITLINEVINAYFNILDYENQLTITRETIALRKRSLELVNAKLIAGTASGLTVAQAEAELAIAEQEVPQLEMKIGQEENYLCLLMGIQPQPIRTGLTLGEQIIVPAVKSTGIPSMVIVNRPDVMMAEQQLISANANIGVARANMLPSLTISGYAGGTFNPVNFIYSAVGNLVAPVFAGGRLRANVKISEAQKAEMLASYQKTIHSALTEVSDAVLAVIKSREIVESQQKTVKAAKTAYDLSNQLYDAGYASFLDVIQAQGLLFSSQISLSRAQSGQLASMINLYKALGGGLK